jgi:hypothetical protein
VLRRLASATARTVGAPRMAAGNSMSVKSCMIWLHILTKASAYRPHMLMSSAHCLWTRAWSKEAQRRRIHDWLRHACKLQPYAELHATRDTKSSFPSCIRSTKLQPPSATCFRPWPAHHVYQDHTPSGTENKRIRTMRGPGVNTEIRKAAREDMAAADAAAIGAAPWLNHGAV